MVVHHGLLISHWVIVRARTLHARFIAQLINEYVRDGRAARAPWPEPSPGPCGRHLGGLKRLGGDLEEGLHNIILSPARSRCMRARTGDFVYCIDKYGVFDFSVGRPHAAKPSVAPPAFRQRANSLITGSRKARSRRAIIGGVSIPVVAPNVPGPPDRRRRR